MIFLPNKLSWGQKQRITFSRALVVNPKVVSADAPKATLDSKNRHEVVKLLRKMTDLGDTTVLMVTHDHLASDFADRIIKMEDGRVVDSE